VGEMLILSLIQKWFLKPKLKIILL
jgi:hypothetical protein